MAQKVLCCYQNNWTKEYTKEVVRSSHPPLDKITFKHKKADVVASPFQHPTSKEVVVSKVIAQNNYTNQCLHVRGKQLDRMEEKVEKKVILQPGNPSKPSPALEKPLVKLLTTRQASLKSKDQTALEICLQKMEELVKKEPVTPSPDTTSSSRLVTLDACKASRSLVKKRPVISSPKTTKSRRLVVLDVHTASSSSSRTSSDSDKEIEKLENQFQNSQSLATPPKKIWVSKFRGKESSETFHRKRIAAKYYRKQKFKFDDFYKKGKSKSTSKPVSKASGKCFKCGKRGHLRTKCESKARILTNTIVCQDPYEDSANTPKPEVQKPEVNPKILSTKPKKKVTVNDLQKEIKDTKSEVQSLRESLASLKANHNQRLEHLENTLHQDNEQGTSSQNPSDGETDNPIKDMVQEGKFLETINRINFQKWHSKVRIVIDKDFEFEVIALIDSGADLNCIQEGIIPSKYFKKTRERLTSASGGRMKIEFKIPNAHVCQDNTCFKTTFVLVKNMTDRVILGNPFMCLLYHFITDNEGSTTHPFGQPVKFKFLRKLEPREINTLQDIFVSKTLNLIKAKTQHLVYLKDDLRYTQAEE